MRLLKTRRSQTIYLYAASFGFVGKSNYAGTQQSNDNVFSYSIVTRKMEP